MDIPQIITTLRKKKNLSQAELASKIGMTQATLSNIESNKKKPHKATISKICRELEIPEKWFYFLAIQESDLPSDGKEKFQAIGNELKDIILNAL